MKPGRTWAGRARIQRGRRMYFSSRDFAALDVVGGRWKGLLIWRLSIEPLRTGQLRRLLPDITQKMLTQQLRSLEAEGVVARAVEHSNPPKVQYSLTQYGRTVLPVVMAITEWGNAHAKRRRSAMKTDQLGAA